MDKYLSVITNFGCHYSCPYCIVRENNLHIPKTTIEGLKNLKTEIIKNKCNWVSISGGGDPLYNYENNLAWYEEFFRVLPPETKTELHTSYIDLSAEVYTPYDRVVYHLIGITDIGRIKRYGDQIVRVVFVVNKSLTPDMIDLIVSKVKENPNIDELSFRQMVDSNYNTTHYCEDYLRAGHKKDWWYIEQNDYNLYYSENKVSYKYKDFEKEEV